MTFIHFDEAKTAASQIVREWLKHSEDVCKALIIGDLAGRLRLILWQHDEVDVTALIESLSEQCGTWWSGEILYADRLDNVTAEIWQRAWYEGRHDASDPRLRILDRHRSRTGWFLDSPTPIWSAAEGTIVVVFYSFKGGLGRSTVLTSFALQRAQAGDRVCVLDFDLDSPGVGHILSADAEGTTARWGIVDFLLEHGMPNAPLDDYFHRCDRVAGPGEVIVFPSGTLDETYADKLARVDIEESPVGTDAGIGTLLRRIRNELRPAWILLDARTGISESAGQLLSGVGHIHILLGTDQEQSWTGLNRVLDRFGKDRVAVNQSQLDLILVHAMVPAGPAGDVSVAQFSNRAEREFTDRYYVEASDNPDEKFWDVGDIDSRDAPHVAIPINYDQRLAAFRDVVEIVDILAAVPYSSLGERIGAQFDSERDA